MKKQYMLILPCFVDKYHTSNRCRQCVVGCFIVVSDRCLRARVLWTFLEKITNDCTSKIFSAKKVLCTTFLGDVYSRLWGRRQTPGVARRVCWSLTINLGQMNESWFNINHGWRKKHAAVRPLTTLAEWYIWSPGRLSPSEQSMNWTVSLRFPVRYETFGSFCCLGVWTNFQIGSRKPILCFSFGHRIVSIPLAKRVWPWVAGDLEASGRRALMGGINSAIFFACSSLLFSVYLYPTSLSWWHGTCTKVCEEWSIYAVTGNVQSGGYLTSVVFRPHCCIRFPSFRSISYETMSSHTPSTFLQRQNWLVTWQTWLLAVKPKLHNK